MSNVFVPPPSLRSYSRICNPLRAPRALPSLKQERSCDLCPSQSGDSICELDSCCDLAGFRISRTQVPRAGTSLYHTLCACWRWSSNCATRRRREAQLGGDGRRTSSTTCVRAASLADGCEDLFHAVILYWYLQMCRSRHPLQHST